MYDLARKALNVIKGQWNCAYSLTRCSGGQRIQLQTIKAHLNIFMKTNLCIFIVNCHIGLLSTTMPLWSRLVYQRVSLLCKCMSIWKRRLLHRGSNMIMKNEWWKLWESPWVIPSVDKAKIIPNTMSKPKRVQKASDRRGKTHRPVIPQNSVASSVQCKKIASPFQHNASSSNNPAWQHP